MSNCLYVKLNSETIIKKYSYKNTDGTLKLNIDNKNNEISGQVLKTPGNLTIVKNSSTGDKEEFVFDGQTDVKIELSEVDAYTGKSSNNTASVIVDNENNTIDVSVNIDNNTITKNLEDDLQAIGVIYNGTDSIKGNTIHAGLTITRYNEQGE